MKKLLGLIPLLGLLLVLTCAPASALSNGEYEYTLQNNEVHLTKYIGSGGNITIPSAIQGVPVTKIADRCFDDYRSPAGRNVSSVTIPGSIKEIGEMAFNGASSIQRLVIQEGVTTIGNSAFRSMKSLQEVQLPTSAAKSLSECRMAFFNDTSLTHITLPQGMTAVPWHMFLDCSSLRSVSLPATIQLIDEWAFFNCDLRSVEIPRDTQRIAQEAFSMNENLQKLTFAGNKLTEIESLAFWKTDIQGVVMLPTSLKTLDSWIFGHCDDLTGAVLPYGLTKMKGSSVFYECESLQWVTVPSTVNNILNGNGRIVDQCPNAIVYCPAGSYAEQICRKNSNSYLTDASADTTIPVLYNGQRISFGAYGQNPTIVNDRTLVPLRSIFEAMGADVQWDNATRTASAQRGNINMSITIGSSTMYVNGKAKTLDSPARIISDRTMVPVRAIAEAFQADVNWDNPSRTVIIAE